MTDTIDAARLTLMLNDLRLPAIKQDWASFAERADKESWPAARLLATLRNQPDRALSAWYRERVRYLRANFLSHRVWNSYNAIMEACCNAWNRLMDMPQRLASITRRTWAKAVSG